MPEGQRDQDNLTSKEDAIEVSLD